MEWGKIWILKLQHRLRLMLWKVAADALPMRGNITVLPKEMLNFDDSCPLCSAEPDTLTFSSDTQLLRLCGEEEIGQCDQKGS